MNYKNHNCKADPEVKDSYPVYDSDGTYLFRACDKCENEKIDNYDPETFTGSVGHNDNPDDIDYFDF